MEDGAAAGVGGVGVGDRAAGARGVGVHSVAAAGVVSAALISACTASILESSNLKYGDISMCIYLFISANFCKYLKACHVLVVVVVAVFNVHHVEQEFISRGRLHPGVWEENPWVGYQKWSLLVLFITPDV